MVLGRRLIRLTRPRIVMNILLIGRVTPFSEQCGAVAYTADLLKQLVRQGHDVRVLDLTRSSGLALGRLRRFSENSPIERDEEWKLSRFEQLLDLAARLARRLGGSRLHPWLGRPEIWGQPTTPRESMAIRRAVASDSWDAVIINYVWLADAFRLFPSSVCRVVLTHDVWHRHLWGGAGNAWLAKLDAATETAWLNLADVVVAITAEDAAEFSRIGVTQPTLVAPMSSAMVPSGADPHPGRLLFVGSGYEPNVRGVDWFLSEVAPRLERMRPGRFSLDLVGTVGAETRARGRAIPVRVHGLVDSLAPHYARASVVIAPIFEGTGLKVKVVEAIAHGKALVATPEALRGVSSRASDAAIGAADAESFANALIALDSDDAARCKQEQRAASAARDSFSPDACWNPLIEFMRAPH
jgi:glycosyltransferase involved in cell wall biosynthesis